MDSDMAVTITYMLSSAGHTSEQNARALLVAVAATSDGAAAAGGAAEGCAAVEASCPAEVGARFRCSS
jgi:hypothetical protein